jgi:ribosomal protein S18 acetylase RimI-like enzyme
MFTRVLTDTDAAVFHQIRRDALNEEAKALGKTPEWMVSAEVLADRFKTKWSGQSGFFVGAFDPALVGIIFFCARDAKLSALYVMPKHRERGIGRRLLLDAVARAKEWFDPERIWLDVAATNTRARELYLSCGFYVIGPGKLDGEDRMELDLR